MNLQELGWDDFFAGHFAPYAEAGLFPGRIIAEYRECYRVHSGQSDFLAVVAGKLRHSAAGRDDFPAAGDWAAVSSSGEGQGVIQALLPRKSKFSRKAAGQAAVEQIVAANVDTVFLVTALNRDFNLRRLERYLALVWDSGANPVIILNKADLCPDAAAKAVQTEAVAAGVPVHTVSAVSGLGLDSLARYLEPGRTVALLGSSGAGKSTLVNALAGRELQKTQEIREADDRGRHTTTSRQLLPLPQGALLLDTPGMRQLKLWTAGDDLAGTFAEIDELVGQCRFSDCSHENEPGCAVVAALRQGLLDSARYENYKKLRRELAYLSSKQDVQARLAEKNRWKQISKQLKDRYKDRR